MIGATPSRQLSSPAMTRTIPTIPAAEARRLLLDAQGLLTNPARRCTKTTLAKLIDQLGFVQIDSINIVERAHHLTLSSRLDMYRPAMLKRLLERDRALFEHWTHDASVIPITWYPHWHHRFARYLERAKKSAWWREQLGKAPEQVIAHVRERIAREGPLQSRDFEHDRRGESAAWWGWKPQKIALEHLWRSGELAIAGRANFQKVYDLAERIYPDAHAAEPSDRAAHIEWACSTAMERLVIATPSELAAYWRAINQAEARQWCVERERAGELARVMVEHADDSAPHGTFALPNWRARLRRAMKALANVEERMRLLSPFDPVLRDRRRALRLFGFDYRFEAFTPEPKRKYGYYVMPLLHGESLVGRVDPKFQRERGTLEIRKVWWEPGVRPTRARMRGLEAAVSRLAQQIGAETFEFTRR